MKIALFESKAEIQQIGDSSDFKHPLLTTAKFVFLDDKVNSNNQGVSVEDFDSVIQSAIGVPVKMKFVGTAGTHAGSIPIGHITSMVKDTTADGTNRLIGTATLFAQEFPKEIAYLKEAYDKGEAPGISFELLYDTKASIIKEGITWLKNIITEAATFVRNPAYGTRTSLMALASDQSVSDDDFNSAVLQWAETEKEQNVQKGGSKMTEQEIKDLQDKLAAAETKVTELTASLATKDTELTEKTDALATATTTVTELQTKLDDTVKAATIAERTAKMTEAGYKLDADAEKAAAKQAIWLELSEPAFASYLEDFIEAKKSTVATASTRTVATASKTMSLIPRPDVGTASAPPSLANVLESFGSLSRPDKPQMAK